MNSTDAPLQSLRDIYPDALNRDRYGVAPHALRLARLLADPEAPASRVLAVNGEWGSGKTSLYRMAREILNEKAWLVANETLGVDFEDWSGVFNPHAGSEESKSDFANELSNLASVKIDFVEAEIWTSGGRNELIFTLIDALQDHLFRGYEKTSRSRLRVWASKTKRGISRNPNQVVQLAALGFGAFGAIMPGQQDALAGNSLAIGGAGPAAARKVLKKMLEAEIGNRRIILVVDDVDRLPPDRMAQLIAAIWWVRDLKGVTILVLFDRVRVEQAIALEMFGASERSDDDAAHYLEKIIQFAYDVPIPSSQQMFERFRDTLQVISGKKWQNATPFGGRDRDEEAAAILKEWLITPRAVLRLETAVEFDYKMLPRVKIDIHDFAIIVALKIFAPDILAVLRKRCRQISDYRDEGRLPPLETVDVREASLSDRVIAFLLPNYHLSDGQHRANENQLSVQARAGFGDPDMFQTYLAAYPTDKPVFRALAQEFIDLALDEADSKEWQAFLRKLPLHDSSYSRLKSEVYSQVRENKYDEDLTELINASWNSQFSE